MRVLILIAAFGSTAHADYFGVTKPAPEPEPYDAAVVAEVAAGTGGESEGAGYGVASARVGAEYAHLADPDLKQRGLAHCAIENGNNGEGCFWFFTGLDPEQVDGAGVSIDGSMLLRPDGETFVAGGYAWAAKAGWQLSARGEVQPVGSLRDTFWRSGRGIYSRNVRVDIPSMWALGTQNQQLIVMPSHVALGERTLRDGGKWSHAGFDRDIAMVAFRWQSKYHTLDLGDVRYEEWGVKERKSGGVTYGKSAGTLGLDASLRVRPIAPLEFFVRGGFASYDPVTSFQIMGNSEHSGGPFKIVPGWWGEARLLDLRGVSATLGGGSWTRLEPGGNAVDTGHMGNVEVTYASDRFDLKGSAQLGKLRRILVGPWAPEDIEHTGTRFVMGRAALDASFRIISSVHVAATAWVERSDRDDPRWSLPSTGLATRAGADISAMWRFERGTKRTTHARVE